MNFAPKILLCAQLIVLSVRNANIVSEGKASRHSHAPTNDQQIEHELRVPRSGTYIMKPILLR